MITKPISIALSELIGVALKIISEAIPLPTILCKR